MMENTVLEENTLEKSEKFPVIFEFGMKKLIKSKSNALIELRHLELNLIHAKHELAFKERDLLLNTDFKDLGLTNEKMRNAFVNEQLSGDIIKIDTIKHSIASKKDDIEVVNDLIKFNELLMKGE